MKDSELEEVAVEPNNDGAVGMVLLLEAVVHLGIGIHNICVSAAAFRFSLDNAAAACAIPVVCAAVNPGNTPADTRFVRVAVTD